MMDNLPQNEQEQSPKMRFGEIFTHFFSVVIMANFFVIGYAEAIYAYKFDNNFKWFIGIYMFIVATAYIGVYLPNKLVSLILKKLGITQPANNAQENQK